MPITRGFIKWCSFFFSTIYTVLLILWLGSVGPPELKTVFGFVHGIGWNLANMSVAMWLVFRNRTPALPRALPA